MDCNNDLFVFIFTHKQALVGSTRWIAVDAESEAYHLLWVHHTGVCVCKQYERPNKHYIKPSQASNWEWLSVSFWPSDFLTRELTDRSKKINSFIFCHRDPISESLLKITLKFSTDFCFFADIEPKSKLPPKALAPTKKLLVFNVSVWNDGSTQKKNNLVSS